MNWEILENEPVWWPVNWEILEQEPVWWPGNWEILEHEPVWTYTLGVWSYTLSAWTYTWSAWTYTLGIRAGGRAAAATSQELSTSGKAPGPSRAGSKYPVRESLTSIKILILIDFLDCGSILLKSKVLNVEKMSGIFSNGLKYI